MVRNLPCPPASPAPLLGFSCRNDMVFLKV
jgi:hypothetical protein